jgi:hypothetical protein
MTTNQYCTQYSLRLHRLHKTYDRRWTEGNTVARSCNKCCHRNAPMLSVYINVDLQVNIAKLLRVAMETQDWVLFRCTVFRAAVDNVNVFMSTDRYFCLVLTKFGDLKKFSWEVPNIKNFMKIRAGGNALIYVDRRKDRHVESNTRFSLFMRTSLKA